MLLGVYMKKLNSFFLMFFLFASLFAETNNYISQNNEQNATFEEQDLINLIKNFDEIGQELMQINFSSDELNNEITTVLNNFGIVGENAIEKVGEIVNCCGLKFESA